MPRRSWTEGEIKRANDMRAAGYSYPTIDKMPGRRPGAFRAAEYLVAERDALAAARDLRALTENFCGGPPPGYSALYGKTGLR